MRLHALCLCSILIACASSPPSPEHGTHSDLTTTASSLALCEHKVPAETCARCHPELVAQYKKVNDWCAEHDRPESQCLTCHPDLTFDPLPALPADADVAKISTAGEDVASLAAFSVKGKVTIFDFYADWCAPCRKIDAHVFRMMQTRGDLAVRKLNVVSWETPVAKRYLTKVSSLPYVVVYDKSGNEVQAISGLDLEKLDAAISAASAK